GGHAGHAGTGPHRRGLRADAAAGRAVGRGRQGRDRRRRPALGGPAPRRPGRVLVPSRSSPNRRRGGRRGRPRAGQVHAPARPEPRRAHHPVPQHGPDVPGHGGGRRRPPHGGLRGGGLRARRRVTPASRITDDEPGAEQLAETADSLSMAFLVLLENLSPVERAVFLLREVFEYDYDEIARIVGKSEDNCRQIAVRARRRIGEGKPRFEVDRRRRDELAQKFWAATLEGDTASLIDLLAEDVVLWGDGGGVAAGAFREAIH